MIKYNELIAGQFLDKKFCFDNELILISYNLFECLCRFEIIKIDAESTYDIFYEKNYHIKHSKEERYILYNKHNDILFLNYDDLKLIDVGLNYLNDNLDFSIKNQKRSFFDKNKYHEYIIFKFNSCSNAIILKTYSFENNYINVYSKMLILEEDNIYCCIEIMDDASLIKKVYQLSEEKHENIDCFIDEIFESEKQTFLNILQDQKLKSKFLSIMKTIDYKNMGINYPIKIDDEIECYYQFELFTPVYYEKFIFFKNGKYIENIEDDYAKIAHAISAFNNNRTKINPFSGNPIKSIDKIIYRDNVSIKIILNSNFNAKSSVIYLKYIKKYWILCEDKDFIDETNEKIKMLSKLEECEV